MNKLQLALVALATAGTVSLAMPAPASADSAASTRNIILGAAAIAGIAIESNVARKNAQTKNITGYLPDGSAVYADGHVVTNNGYSYYPGNNGQNVSCTNGRCYVANNGNGNQYGNPNSGWANSGNGQYGNGQYRNGQYGFDRGGNGRNGDDRDGDHR